MDIKKAIDIIEWLYEDGNTLSKEAKEALETAVDSLEKQVPKKPVKGYIFHEVFRERLLKKEPDLANAQGSCCPRCGEYIGENETILKKQNGYPHCKWCGQKIDWE